MGPFKGLVLESYFSNAKGKKTSFIEFCRFDLINTSFIKNVTKTRFPLP
jgi:hypothetical protein